MGKAKSKMIKHFAIILTCALALCGCQTAPRYDESARLMTRPDFAAARAAAPEWCRDALKTINFYEEKLEGAPLW